MDSDHIVYLLSMLPGELIDLNIVHDNAKGNSWNYHE